MSILEIELTPEMEQRLRERAERRGLSSPALARIAVESLLETEETDAWPKRSIMEIEGLGAATRKVESATPIVDGERRFDVMDFHGVGREALKNLDVQKYLADLRDEWQR